MITHLLQPLPALYSDNPISLFSSVTTMDVYTFDKSVMERYDDCCMALKFSDSPLSAAKIHSAWQYYLSLLLEPAGWQSLWRLTRPFCEELQIRYPTVVYGTVEQIDFKECKAQFKV